MKILLIHNYYRKKNIGGEDIVFDAEVGALKKRLGDSNVFVYTVSSDDTTGWRLLFSIWFSLSQYRAVYALVKKHNIDIVHVHNFFPVLTPSVFVAAKNAGAGVVHTLHNYRLWCISGILYNAVDGVHEYCATKRFSWRCVQHKSYHDSFVQSLFIGIVFWWYKCMQMFGYIDYYIALTGFQKNKIISFFVPAEKIILKPNFLDMSAPVSRDKENYYLYVGRLEPAKGISDLLCAWESVDTRMTLKIIGTGPLEDPLKEQYGGYPNIEFLGNQPRDVTLGYIAEARYLVQASCIYETFGLTMLEALSCGTPVIGRNLGTRPEFIQHGVNGFLYEEDTVVSVLVMSYAYELYESLQSAAVSSAQPYTRERIVQRQLDIYNSMLA